MTNPFTLLETELQKMVSIHDELQAEIREIHEEIKSLENRPIDASSAVQNLKDYLASQQTGALLADMVEAFSHDRLINSWNNRLTGRCFDNSEAPGAVSSKFIQADLGPMMATFFEQTLLDRMGPMINAYCKKHGGIAAEARETQLAELREKAHELEEQEEAAINEAEINDVWSFTRRVDADPSVILNLTG